MGDRLHTLREYLEESPDDAFLLFAIAQEYATAGNHQEAYVYYQRLKHAHADYVALYYHMAATELALGLRDAAIDTFRNGMSVAKAMGDQHAFLELKRELDAVG